MSGGLNLVGPPEGGRSTPQIHLLQAPILVFLLFYVLPYHRFVSTYGRDEVPSSPEVLPHEITLLLPVDTGQMDRTLALDKPNHLRDRIFRWNRDHHVNVIRHEMAFFNLAFLLQRQLAEDLAEMPSQFPVKRLSAALGNEHNMILHSHLLWLRLSYSSIVKLPFVCLLAHDRKLHRWTTAVKVKLLLPPRQSRGTSLGG